MDISINQAGVAIDATAIRIGHLAHRKKNRKSFHIIVCLLTKLFLSRRLDIGRFLSTPSQPKICKKNLAIVQPS